MLSPFSYHKDCTLMVVGVGLMGQYLVKHARNWLSVRRVILVDATPEIQVGTEKVPLAEFGAAALGDNPTAIELATSVLDVTSENDVRALFERHQGVHYIMHTAGISPRPLTPPEDLVRDDVLRTCDVNLWGTHNVICQGLKTGAFVRGARGVVVLSTSGTVGSEGRASAAYEEAKGGLCNFVRLQARYFVEKFGFVHNGLAPSPLRGPMAAQNPVSAARLAAVERAMPMGALTNPEHIAGATMFFFADQCWCAGEILTVDGGYTKHRPIFGPLEK